VQELLENVNFFGCSWNKPAAASVSDKKSNSLAKSCPDGARIKDVQFDGNDPDFIGQRSKSG